MEKLTEVAREIEKQGGQAQTITCDVTQSKDTERAVRETVARFGRLDVLVNNAGAVHISTVESIPEQEWDRIMLVNLKGPFLMSRAALPELRRAGGGSIINIGSVVGLIGMKDRAAYATSKGGVTILTKAMAMDYAHEKIRVNCICPALVETELIRDLFGSGLEGEAARRSRIAQIPLGRIGRPEDVADMAVFLASKESSWVTGAAIPLDGGFTAY
jgi:NAD(P)-dependent dehydrogenase (short-subunit alcohol dehydrogenase family)